MPDILAIVSKAVFEEQALLGGDLIGIGAVWDIDRYFSKHKSFNPLREGGRIILVTVRPPGEQLWFVGSIESPIFDGTAWIGKGPNTRPVTNISALRGTIMFESGKGISQAEGALGMSLQTPRTLTPASSAEILAVVAGAQPRPRRPPVAPQAASGAEPMIEVQTETPAMRAEKSAREAALENEVARFVVLFDKMQETHGLRLPESLAYGIGFIMGLEPHERAELETHVGKLIGVGSWFGDSDRARAPADDERLRDRVLNDPPEFVPVLEKADGSERWGLWYDDTDELPTGIAVRSRGAGEKTHAATKVRQRTLLTALRTRVVDMGMTTGGGPTPTAAHHASILSWLDDALRLEAARVTERSTVPMPPMRDGSILGERMDPYVPEWDLPADLLGYGASMARRSAYEEGASDVDEWIERARAELRDGSPVRALFLGRELHARQPHLDPRLRLPCTELLIRAYTALGRQPLADIVRAAYRHSDPSLPIYELPPPHPISAAAASGDVTEILAALEKGDEPSEGDLEEALASARTVEALDALLDEHARHESDGARTDTALWRHLQMMFRARKTKTIALHRKLAMRLMERGTVNARAFDRILRAYDAELIAAAAARVDLRSVSLASSSATPLDDDAPKAIASTFTTPLHLAARACAPAAVRMLLDRGIDPRATNSDNRMAYDAAREAQIENPSDPRTSEIMTMLQLAGGGMAKPPLPASDEVEYCEGDAVHHPKLGDGIVLSVVGEGEEAKLKIRFETETKQFLAKFVTPKASA